MKLTKKEVERVCLAYDIGKLKKFELIKFGIVNHNYDIITDQGKFIIRIFGQKLTPWKKENIKRQFMVLEYLEKVKFPYKVPIPIKSKNKRITYRINGKTLWVYRKIEGDCIKRLNKTQLINVARAFALYHKTIGKIIVERKTTNYRWLFENYVKMERITPKNKTDRLMLENIEFFRNLLPRLEENKTGESYIISHSDFHASNILFKENRVVGILDFDNVNIWPRAKDLANTLRDICSTPKGIDKKKMKIFLKEYTKTIPLTKNERKEIVPYILGHFCTIFWWFYEGMKKATHMRQVFLENTIARARGVAKEENLLTQFCL